MPKLRLYGRGKKPTAFRSVKVKTRDKLDRLRLKGPITSKCGNPLTAFLQELLSNDEATIAWSDFESALDDCANAIEALEAHISKLESELRSVLTSERGTHACSADSD